MVYCLELQYSFHKAAAAHLAQDNLKKIGFFNGLEHLHLEGITSNYTVVEKSVICMGQMFFSEQYSCGKSLYNLNNDTPLRTELDVMGKTDFPNLSCPGGGHL